VKLGPRALVSTTSDWYTKKMLVLLQIETLTKFSQAPGSPTNMTQKLTTGLKMMPVEPLRPEPLLRSLDTQVVHKDFFTVADKTVCRHASYGLKSHRYQLSATSNISYSKLRLIEKNCPLV